MSAEGGMDYSRLACRVKAAANPTYCLLHVGYMHGWFTMKYSNGNARRLGEGCLLHQMRCGLHKRVFVSIGLQHVTSACRVCQQ